MPERTVPDDEADHAGEADDVDSAGETGWPLDAHKRSLLAQLARLIAQHGAARFVEARLVRADLRDFPDPWKRTLPAVRTLLDRLFWHAYLDAEVVIEDARGPRVAEHVQLLDSDIDLIEAAHGRVVFQVTEIGNDDVAGLLAHQVGLAFAKQAPESPFREARVEPTAADGTLAAVFLGLGVLAANSAIYRRHASQLVGREVRSEHKIAMAGGLELDDVAFLLAVQDVVREEPQEDALATLSAAAAERFEDWAVALESHHRELSAELGLDDAPSLPLSRTPAPRRTSGDDAPSSKLNAGRRVYRVPHHLYHREIAGVSLGLLGFLAGLIPGLLTTLAGAVAGRLATPRYFRCSDRDCERVMKGELALCPGCGGAIAMTIAHANERLERDEELDAAAASAAAPDDGDTNDASGDDDRDAAGAGDGTGRGAPGRSS